MTSSRPNRRIAYVFLAILFAGSIAFQAVISAQAIRGMASQIASFQTGAITGVDIEFFAHVLTPFACLALAFYVARARVWDARAWLLLAVLISFSLQADGSNSRDEAMRWTTPFNHLALAYRSFGVYSLPLWLVLFAIYFPERPAWARRHTSWKWMILVPFVALCGWPAVLRVAFNETGSRHIEGMRRVANPYWVAAFYLSVVFFLAALL